MLRGIGNPVLAASQKTGDLKKGEVDIASIEKEISEYLNSIEADIVDYKEPGVIDKKNIFVVINGSNVHKELKNDTYIKRPKSSQHDNADGMPLFSINSNTPFFLYANNVANKLAILPLIILIPFLSAI